MDNKLRNKISVILGCAALVLLTVGSFAYFTDSTQVVLDATAGTLDLSLTQDWTGDNVSVADTFSPGKKLDLDYTLTNNGNKSADIKETFVITSEQALAGDPLELEIYEATDVTQDPATGFWKPNEGANPITTKSVSEDNLKVTYDLAEFVLNGTGANAETEDSATSNSKTGNYVLVFKDSASNDFQGKKITIDYMAQAKQHRNTNSDTWTTVKTATIDFAGESTSVVPDKE